MHASWLRVCYWLCALVPVQGSVHVMGVGCAQLLLYTTSTYMRAHCSHSALPGCVVVASFGDSCIMGCAACIDWWEAVNQGDWIDHEDVYSLLL
jgi:hypothetical protein